MPLLQRYLLGQLFRVLAAVVAVLTIVVMFGGVFEEVRQSGLGPFEALQVLPYVVPSLLPFTIPAALLLTVCIVYGRFAADQELVAANAAGIPVLTLLWPALFLGGLLSACSLLLFDQVIPWSVSNIRRVAAIVVEDVFLDNLRTNNQVTLPGADISITVFGGVRGRTLVRPMVRYRSREGKIVIATAASATPTFRPDQSLLRLTLSDCHIEIPGQGSLWAAEWSLSRPLAGSHLRRKPRHMSLRTIRRELQQLAGRQRSLATERDLVAAMLLTTGDFFRFAQPDFQRHQGRLAGNRLESARFRTELHGRFALASSCFLFVLIGAPVSLLQARRQVHTNFLLCFGPIILLYYPIVLLCMNQCKIGALDPSWGMWIGNAMLLVAGGWFLRQSLRH